MAKYTKEAPGFKFSAPGTKASVLGGGSLLLVSVLLGVITAGLKKISQNITGIGFIKNLANIFNNASLALCICGIVILGIGILSNFLMRDTARIRLMVRKGLFCSSYGNPLKFKEGDKLPKITCKELDFGKYELIITATSVTVEQIQGVSSSISSCLRQKFKNYAVTRTNADLASNNVAFLIEDVTVDGSLVVYSPKELKGEKPTLIPVQEGINIDLTTSGSILAAGKTRSGKTTGVISMLLSALEWGRDEFGSEIIIIDPKGAELSKVPYVYTMDENDEPRSILDAIKKFADTIKRRQRVLNDLSEQRGDAVKWWDAGMHISFLFIDEYVALRSYFPKRSTKENEGYSLADFDGLVRRIATMGASAGCYMIISIAEASVEEGGLPSMVRSAMSTKILFRPTMSEARLLWSTEKLQDFKVKRDYSQGDAWFSSTDGVHDNVSFVHFPIMKFREYKELGASLEAYYGKKGK